MTATPKTPWTTIITKWGISLEAAHYFHLAPTTSGDIIYPANPGERNRVLIVDPTPRQPKNIWDTHTSHLPVSALFHLAALQLPEAQSTTYLANGEKSTMAMWTAGIHNVVNTFGEGNRVNDAIQLLKAHRIQHLTIIPDCDSHGIRTAHKWYQHGTAAGLTITVLDLRVYLETQYGMSPTEYNKWDTRDLWLLQEQDKELFVTTLKSLPIVDFNRYAEELPKNQVTISPRQPKPRPRRSNEIDYLALYDEWWFEVVIPQLDRVSPPPTRGKHRTCPNPNHPDRHPSFRLAEDGMVFCTCGIQDEPKPREIVASWVGAISWDDYKKQAAAEQQAQREALFAHPEALRHFPSGVPNILRETLLGIHQSGYFEDHAAALVTYEVWHEGIFDGQFDPHSTINIEDLVEYAANSGRSTSGKTFRKGLKQLIALGFFIQAGQQQSYRGRPLDLYQAQNLPAAIEVLVSKLIYRQRENVYRDVIPDIVTADWFPDDEPEIAEILADYENYQRVELYAEKQTVRVSARHRYDRRIARLETFFTVNILLRWKSSRLDPTHTWGNGRNYRDTYYLAQALNRAKHSRNITRQRAANQLGVSGKTLGQIRARVGIATDPQFKTTKITTPTNVRDQADFIAPWAKNNKYGRFVSSSSGKEKRIDPTDDPTKLDRWVARELKAKKDVVIKIQVGSQERLATEEEIEALKVKAERRRERARLRYERRKQSPKNPPIPREPLEEIILDSLAPLYIQKQLNLIPRDEFVIESIRQGAIPYLPPLPEELIPFLPTSYHLPLGKKGGEKGNKSPSDTPSDNSDPPP